MLAALLGGIAMFVYGAISHMVLQIGDTGIKSAPDDAKLQSCISDAVDEDGFYFFPGLDEKKLMTLPKEEQDAAMADWMARYEQGPIGIVIYHAHGVPPMSPEQLGTQFATDLVTALLASVLLGFAAAKISGYPGRVLFVTLLGVFPVFSILAPWWNWYRFPTEFMVGAVGDSVLTALAGGLVIALIVRD